MGTWYHTVPGNLTRSLKWFKCGRNVYLGYLARMKKGTPSFMEEMCGNQVQLINVGPTVHHHSWLWKLWYQILNYENKVHKNYYYMVIQDTFVIKWQMGPVLRHNHINAIGIYSTPLIFSTLSCYLNTTITRNTIFYYTSFESSIFSLTRFYVHKIDCHSSL